MREHGTLRHELQTALVRLNERNLVQVLTETGKKDIRNDSVASIKI